MRDKVGEKLKEKEGKKEREKKDNAIYNIDICSLCHSGDAYIAYVGKLNYIQTKMSDIKCHTIMYEL